MENNDIMKLRFQAIESNNAYFYGLVKRHGSAKAIVIFKSFMHELERQLSFKEDTSVVKKRRDTRVYVNLRKYGYDFNKSDEERHDAIQNAINEHGPMLVEKCCTKFGKYHSIVLKDWEHVSSNPLESQLSDDQKECNEDQNESATGADSSKEYVDMMRSKVYDKVRCYRR
jgi:hypothetical protein